MRERGDPGRPHGPTALAGLCVVEFGSWGVLYYTLPVIGTTITTSTSWSPPAVPAIYTATLLTAAASGSWAGRMVDKHGPRPVMAGGSALGAAALALSGATSSIVLFTAAWLVIGVAQACTLYQPAFAAAARWFGTTSNWPLTIITLAGGISSTVFAPVIAALAKGLGWQITLVLLACGYFAVVSSATVLLLRLPWHSPTRQGRDHTMFVNQIVRSRVFRDTRLALALVALGLYAVTLNMVPLLTELGFDYGAAALVFGLIGAGQILGRLLFLPLGRRGTPRSRTVVQVTASATVIGLLAVLSSPLVLVAAVAVLAGAVRGAHTLSAATALTDRWGTDSFATIQGRFNVPVAGAMAIGPAVGAYAALLLDSYRAAAGLLACLSLTAIWIARRT